VSTTELHYLTIAEAAAKLAARQLSPVELVQAALERIEEIDPQVNAFITVTADLALSQARAAETEIAAGRYRGRLHGIPFGLKDVYNTSGILTSGGSRAWANHFPGSDATAVSKLYAEGAVLLGKLATYEFAHGGPSFDLPWPPARNPWNLMHVPGGSSNGSGAAVAAGLTYAALGTDTAGSVRDPASLCGVVAIKPTFGLVSRAGVIPNNFSLDYCGPFTRTVEDCAIVLRAIAGYDTKDPASARYRVPDYHGGLTRDIRGMRIGVVRHFWEDDLRASDDLCAAMDTALGELTRLGAKVSSARMRPLQQYWDVRGVIGETEPFAIHQKDFAERIDQYGVVIRGRVLPSCLFQAIDYVQAQRWRRRMVAEFEALFESYDVLVTAGTGPAKRFEAQRELSFFDRWARPNIYAPFSVTGAPALALPVGRSKDGLPLGMQVVGRAFDEQTVFNVAHAYEQSQPWKDAHPALAAGNRPQPLQPPSMEPAPVTLDAKTREFVRFAAVRAGLRLDDRGFALLCEAAPYALAMSDRVSRSLDPFDEPADVFRLDAPG
jgi:aspartyl-tRNA(Asn)/glutamyl-tRNA(Gln) amidotransferase subunit A